MNYLLLLFTIFLSAFNTLISKFINKDEPSLYERTKTNLMMFIFAFLIVFIMGLSSLKTIFEVPWVLAFIYAIGMVCGQSFLMKALELGPVSITSLIHNSGFIISTLFGSIYYKEKINFLHIIGFFLIISSLLVSIKKDKKKANLFWFVMCSSGCLCGGILGVCQKVFNYEYSQYNLDNFLCIAFLFMILISCLFFLIIKLVYKKNETDTTLSVDKTTPSQQNEQHRINNKFVLIISLGGLIGCINKLSTFLSGVLPSIIIFPSLNCGKIIGAIILSKLIFKEKLTFFQKLAFVLGGAGIVCTALGGMIV